MSPLDDELRGALSSRTRTIDPSPDLLAGVERRASRMRRRKVAAGIAGSALTLGAVAVGGPMAASTLTGSANGALARTTSAPAPAADLALDPADPWPYRGLARDELGSGTVEAVRAQLAAVRGADLDDVALSPLYGQRDEDTQAVDLFYVASVDGAPRWGVARSSESGPELLVDRPLAAGTVALPTVLPLERLSLVVVVAHESTTVQYCPAGAGSCGPSSSDAGVGRAALAAVDPARDTYRVLAPDGTLVVEGPAPDDGAGQAEAPATERPPGDEVPPPSNVVDWPTRGGAAAELVEGALTRYAEQEDVTREQVGGKLLYAYQPPGDGSGYLLLQVWSGGDARTLGVRFDGRSGLIRATSLSGPTPPGPAVLAVLLPGGSGPVQQLLVVPEPGASEVRYSPGSAGEPQPVAGQGTGAAVVIPRDERAVGDSLLVLDADRAQPVYRGPVEELLTGAR